VIHISGGSGSDDHAQIPLGAIAHRSAPGPKGSALAIRESATRNSDNQGFTLLELMVMLVVLGLLMVSLAQGTRLGLRARQLDAETQAESAALEATARVVRQLIARAAPGDPTSQDPSFVGAPHAATFITSVPAGVGAAAATEAEVNLTVGAGHRLELLWQPHYRRWIIPRPAPRAAALINGVDRLDLAYWQSRPDSAAGTWIATWTAPNLPTLVRVRLVFPPGDRRHWPDIVVAPMRQAPRP
jgi:general secretion pathway protein J